jgi:hypothetical protein
VQQYTYPDFIFYTRGDEEVYAGKAIEIRSGIYRFMVTDYIIALFSFFFVWQRCLEKGMKLYKRIFFFFFLLIICVGIYYNQTRQIMIAAIIAILLTTLHFFKNKKLSTSYYVIVSIVFIVIIAFQGYLFEELIEKTEIHFNDDDYVRYRAIPFFIFDYWYHWINVILGNGCTSSFSSYGKDYAYVHDVLKLSRGDVGIIGVFNTYGLIFISVYISYLFLILRKLWRYLEYYQKLFFISSLIMMMTVVPFYNGHKGSFFIILYSIYFYLIDTTVMNKRLFGGKPVLQHAI